VLMEWIPKLAVEQASPPSPQSSKTLTLIAILS
jgi:hypothetical protein